MTEPSRSSAAGATQPSTGVPSTSSATTPRLTWPGFSTRTVTTAPRKCRAISKPSHAAGMHGSTHSPSRAARTPSRYWVTPTYVQLAVPVSQGLRAWPKRGDVGPCVNCAYTYGSAWWISAASLYRAGR